MKFFLLFIFFLLPLSAQDYRLEKVSLQLNWKYQYQFAGYIAAKEKGFYNDAGLDVELKEYENGINVIDDILSGKTTYAVYNSNALFNYVNNESLNILSSYFKRSSLVLITKKSIKSPKDLKNKIIMAFSEKNFKMNFQAILDENNIDISEIKFIPFTNNILSFKNADAIVTSISDLPFKFEQLGLKYNIINPIDIGQYNLQHELFTSNREVSKKLHRTIAFRNASVKGWKYALENKKELVDIIYNKYTNNISKSELYHEAVEIEKLILPHTYKIGSIDKNILTKKLQITKLYYQITDELFSDNIVENKINFNIDELNYLNTHKVIKICLLPDIFPLDGFINNQHIGIMADLLKIVGEKLDTKLLPIESKNYIDLKNKIKNKDCEIVSAIQKNSTLSSDITSSISFHKTYFALISTIDKSFVDDTNIIKNRILIVNSILFQRKLKNLYPFLNIQLEKNISLMMKKVINGDVYAAITLNESSDYMIEKYGYGKLKINGFLAKENLIDVSIGVLKSEPLLLSIINKALISISDEKIDTIIKNWRITRYNEVTDYSLIFFIILIVFILILIMSYYQRKLKDFNSKLEQQVKLKTQELIVLNETLEVTVQEKVSELIKKDKILTVQSKQAVMGEMISMIAHQWRQPLSTITLQISNYQFKQLLQKNSKERAIDKTLAEISDTIIYLSDTIDDFQTYFRPNRVQESIKTREIIEKVLTLADARIQRSSIEIITKCYDDYEILIYVNELVQVILNILNNAIDAFENIDRDIKKIEVIGKITDNKLAISIKDNASGIAKENINSLFDPYFSTKGKNGTGLGLYMSQMIIQKQFSGTIEVDTSNQGTIFTINFPLVLD